MQDPGNHRQSQVTLAEQPVAHPDCALFTDGHAGNLRQARALAAALGFPQARHVTLQPGAMARALAPRRMPGFSPALGSDFAHCLRQPPKLAIGCGRQGALATRLLREAGSVVIQILDPRLDARHWDAVVVPAHDRIAGPNVIRLQGSLHDVDDLSLAAARNAFPDFAALPSPRVGLLLGGPTPHWALEDTALVDALGKIAAHVRNTGGSWLATSSRRTPDAWREAMHHTGLELPGFGWRDQRDGANPYAGLLAWADVMVATPDSVNMLSEAAATHASLYLLQPQRMQGRPAQFVQMLLKSGRAQPFGGALETHAAEPLREMPRVVRALHTLLGARLPTAP